MTTTHHHHPSPSITTMSNRASQAKALLGDDLYHRVRDSKVLVVGAGGIGCELRECDRLDVDGLGFAE